MLYFLDTSAILNGALKEYPNAWISPIAIQELEQIKISNKPDSIQYLARQAVRDIINSLRYNIFYCAIKDIEKFIKHHHYLTDSNDHKLLASAALLAREKKQTVQFITSDGALFLFAKTIPNLDCQLYEETKTKIEYRGWNKYTPTDLQFISLYSHPEINIFNAKINEFCEIYEKQALKDILIWTGARYSSLKYQNFKNMFGENIMPRNLEQKMLFHLLQDDNIKIKLGLGTYGSGKTFIMLQHALKGVKDGRFSKIIFVRNNIITKGSRDIGFLSGSLVEKIKPYLMPIADLTTPEYLDEIIAEGILEPVPLGFMRGRDFSNNTLVFCDEAENLTRENIQLLIGRIGEGSQLWIAGDLKQIDHSEFEKNNGLRQLMERLSGNKLFGMVRLMQSERSETAELANLLD